MELKLAVTTETETYQVTAKPLAIVRWERRQKKSIGSLASGGVGAEDIFALAYEATRAAGMPVPAQFDDWLTKVVDVSEVSDEYPDPTSAAPSAG